MRLYNNAVEVAAQSMFEVARVRGQPVTDVSKIHNLDLRMAVHGFERTDAVMPVELLASNTLGFDNMRAIFRRDGFGSSLVAVFPRPGEVTPAPLDTAVAAAPVAMVEDAIAVETASEEVATCLLYTSRCV